jgi:hypothetical protein
MIIEEADPLLEGLAALIAEAFAAERVQVEVQILGEVDPTWMGGTYGPRAGDASTRELVREVRQEARCIVGGDWTQVCLPVPHGHVLVEREHAFDTAEVERLARFVGRLAPAFARLTPHPDRMSLSEQVQRLKQQRVYESLRRHDWSVLRVARELDVARSYVYRVIAGVRRQRRRSASLRRARP